MSVFFRHFTVLPISLSVFVQIIWFLAHFEGKLKHYQRPISTGLNRSGSHRSLAVFTRSGLLRSFNFAVLSGPGPVQSRSLAGPRTRPSNTSDLEGFRGLLVARVRSFLSIRHNKVLYPCALVSWYSAIGNQPCPVTKMWKVQPDLDHLGQPILDSDIIHLDTTLRNAHLMGVCDEATPLPYNFKFHDSLDSFKAFYVNKYIDHHAHEIAF